MISERLVAFRYAKALVSINRDLDSLLRVQQEFNNVLDVLCSCKEMEQLINCALFTPTQKWFVIEEILQKMEVSILVRNFFYVIVKSFRLSLLYVLGEVFNKMVDEQIGVIEVNIKSAKRMTDVQFKKIKDILNYKTGKKVKLKWQRDSSLIGGIKINIGSMVYDMSISGQLSILRAKLLSV